MWTPLDETEVSMAWHWFVPSQGLVKLTSLGQGLVKLTSIGLFPSTGYLAMGCSPSSTESIAL